MITHFRLLLSAILFSALSLGTVLGQDTTAIDPSKTESKISPNPEANQIDSAPSNQSILPTVYQSDFENGIADWQLVDDGWKIVKRGDSQVFSQFKKESNYKPTFRSPFHQAILKGRSVGDFQLDVRVLSTHPDYNHRDACLFFGYQNPSQFYYVHLGKTADPHANQIFIVNNAERTKISLTTTDGTDWNDEWHQVRVKRNVESGEITVFFDDMQKPVMTANDRTFLSGRVGVGSFDDTADWDDIALRGTLVEAVKE